MSDGTEMVKKELEAYVEEKAADARKYGEAPKPRWYVVAAFLGGLLAGTVLALAIVAFR